MTAMDEVFQDLLFRKCIGMNRFKTKNAISWVMNWLKIRDHIEIVLRRR